tara:strand:- start:307 stop:438 length:132 start_codon:yes stop_codon:yes gene_type:complete
MSKKLKVVTVLLALGFLTGCYSTDNKPEIKTPWGHYLPNGDKH